MLRRRAAEDDKKKSRRPKVSHWATARSVGVAVLLVLFLRAFVAEAYVIPSESMQSTLLVGDRLFVDKSVYGLRVPFTTHKLTSGRMPQRGEVVVFVHPRSGETLIKRVVAIGGDSVEMRGEVLWVNDRPLQRTAIEGPCRTGVREQGEQRQLVCRAYWERAYPGGEGAPRYRVLQLEDAAVNGFARKTIPSGHVFLLGDNRDYSADSRVWGALPRSHLMGRALFIYFSAGSEGLRWARFFRPIR